MTYQKAKEVSGAAFDATTQDGLEKAARLCVTEIVKARRAGNDARAAELSEAKAFFARRLRRFRGNTCEVCGERISAKAFRCRMHQQGQRMALPLPASIGKQRSVGRPKAQLPLMTGTVSYHGHVRFPDGEAMFFGSLDNINRISMHAELEKVLSEHPHQYLHFKYAAFQSSQLSEVELRGVAQTAMLQMVNVAAEPSCISESPFAKIYAVAPDFALELLARLRAAQKKKLTKQLKAFILMRTATQDELGAPDDALSRRWAVSKADIRRARKKHGRANETTASMVVFGQTKYAQKSA